MLESLAHPLYDAAYWFAWGVYTFGFSYRCTGRRNVPKTGPALLVANHQSFLDPVAIGLASPRRVSFLARKPLFKNPLFGGMISALNAVPIDQEGVGKEGLAAIIAKLRDGHPVLVFPEGERTADGLLHELKPGIALLVERARCPIVPVGIAGAFHAWPKFELVPDPSYLWSAPSARTIAVAYGPPIDATGARRGALLERVREGIAEQIVIAERLRRKGSV